MIRYRDYLIEKTDDNTFSINANGYVVGEAPTVPKAQEMIDRRLKKIIGDADLIRWGRMAEAKGD